MARHGSAPNVCVLNRAPRPERNEWAPPDELLHRGLGAEITPPENRREEAQPPRMAAPELERHGDALVFGEESLLRNVCLTPDLDLQRRVGAQVADPLGVRAPGRKDDRLAGVRVVASAIATVSRRLPVFRPWWAISRKVWSSIQPQPRW